LIVYRNFTTPCKFTRMPRKGGKRVKSRTHQGSEPTGATVLEGGVQSSLEKELVPRSIVARSGKVISQVSELIRDMRKLMGPHTTAKLQEKRANKMKDYAAVASQLGVSHLLLYSQTAANVVMRVARAPNGPTLHFHVTEYSLAAQIRANQKRPHENASNYLTPPLVVLNNFGTATEQHVKLMKVSFQHMFPSVNVKTMKLSECRRVVLFHLRKEDGQVEMRHYAVTASPVGINRNLKKIINGKLPNLSGLTDVSEIFTSGQGLYPASDSEGEDEQSHVQLAQNYIGRGNANSQKSALKLVELGPRMTLRLFKVEQGVCEGEVLHHEFVHKSAEEAKKTKQRLESEAALKSERRATQESNVARKRAAEEEKKATKKRRINKYTVGDDADGDEAGKSIAGPSGGDFEEISDASDNDNGSVSAADSGDGSEHESED
jgi:ribosome biogenesis protein SSF1/2